MGFWGIEIKPGKPHPYHSDNVKGKLYVTQATLGLGSSEKKSILQCSVGHKSPIFLCSLLPDKFECCNLNLEFTDELVAFSVLGDRSIHISGYFAPEEEGVYLPDEYESDSGEDITDTESESDDSSEHDYDDEYDSEFDDDFIVDGDDLEMYPPSPAPKSRVVIKEIVDDDKPTNGDNKQIIVKKSAPESESEEEDGFPIAASKLETEDEDGLPISAAKGKRTVESKPQSKADKKEDEVKTNKAGKKKSVKEENDGTTDKKRKVQPIDQDDQSDRKQKKKNKKQKGVTGKMDDKNDANDLPNDKIQPNEVNNQGDADGKDSNVVGEPSSDKKKKKKNKKKKGQDTVTALSEDQKLETEEKESAVESAKARTFANGLVVENLAMGKPDGTRASKGRQVSVYYTGKLKKTGKIFDSNVGRAPFKFRLGVGQVIKGWDVGVEGMRVGDKRRLTIPPSMGYGDVGAGGKIPPNSWLMFDVELVSVR